LLSFWGHPVYMVGWSGVVVASLVTSTRFSYVATG